MKYPKYLSNAIHTVLKEGKFLPSRDCESLKLINESCVSNDALMAISFRRQRQINQLYEIHENIKVNFADITLMPLTVIYK